MSSYPTNYFGVIPAEVRYHRGLSADAKLLYCEITAGLNADGRCRIKASDLEQMYGVSRATINRWLSELEEAGMIHFEGSVKDPRGRTIRLKKEVATKVEKARYKAEKADNLIKNEQVKPSLRKNEQVETYLRKNEQVEPVLNQICASTPYSTTSTPLCISPNEATTNFELENADDPVTGPAPGVFKVPALDEVLTYARMRGVDPKVAKAFWYKQEAVGWVNGVTPIRKWQPLLHSWQVNSFKPGSSQFAQNNEVPKRPAVQLTEVDNAVLDQAYESIRLANAAKVGGLHG